MTTNSKTTKITKRDTYAVIGAILTEAQNQGFGLPEGFSFADLTEFVKHEVELLDKKTESAAKRAADKKAAGDELRDRVAAVLTGEFQPIAALVNAINDPDVSAQKVTHRLKQLVDLGMAEKEQITVQDSEGKNKKVMGYRAI